MICKLDIDNIPEAAKTTYILTGMQKTSLLGIYLLYNAGCKATFTREELNATKEGGKHLEGMKREKKETMLPPPNN